MSKTKQTINKIKSKIEAIKKLNDNPDKAVPDSLYDKYLKDLPTTDKLFGKKLDALKEKRKRKVENKKDIFGEVLDIFDSIIDVKNKRINYDVTGNETEFTAPIQKRKLRRLVTQAIDKTTRNGRKIVMDNVTKYFFAADGICGSNLTFTASTINMSPKEFDFLNILSVNPGTSVGKIMYESSKTNTKKQRTDRKLYEIFSGGTYSFEASNNKTLFNVSWNSTTQQYQFSGLTQNFTGLSVNDFFVDYYSSLQFPDISGITKNAIQGMLSANNGETHQLTEAQNLINRLCSKLFKLCGSPESNNTSSPVEQFNENDEELEFYFNFEDVEGIDLEEEDARLRKVMRFKDCNNFETEINEDFLEDFVYLSEKQNLDSLIEDAIARAASEAHQQSDGTLPEINFQLPLILEYILSLPKALIRSLITPKIILPIAIIYKIFNNLTNIVIDIKTLFKTLRKMITAIIKDVFWFFIKEFWKLVKKDLLTFISMIALAILKSKYKRYVIIITALINLLKKLLNEGIDNCAAIFGIISQTIDGALSASGGFNVPGFLLGISDKLPGYSKERTLMNITERLNAAGIPTDAINGESNDLLTAVKSIIDGNTEEMDQNSFVKASNSEVKIPTPIGPIVIPPGVIPISGKMF